MTSRWTIIIYTDIPFSIPNSFICCLSRAFTFFLIKRDFPLFIQFIYLLTYLFIPFLCDQDWHMDAQLKWFEDLCTCLQTNPASVTPTLIQLRSSDESHTLACHALSVSSRGDVQFQALLILKHTIVKRWHLCSPAVIADFQGFLWDLISHSSTPLQQFVLNKLIQVS